MTATNVLVHGDAVHLYSDGAAYGSDGRVKGFTSKISLLPHLSCAIGFRGAAVFKSLAIDDIGTAASSFDGLKACISPLLQELARLHKGQIEKCETGDEIEVVVAGISHIEGPSAYLVNSAGRYGAEPRAVQPLEGFVWLPNTDALTAKALQYLPALAADVDPVAHGRMDLPGFSGEAFTL